MPWSQWHRKSSMKWNFKPAGVWRCRTPLYSRPPLPFFSKCLCFPDDSICLSPRLQWLGGLAVENGLRLRNLLLSSGLGHCIDLRPRTSAWPLWAGLYAVVKHKYCNWCIVDLCNWFWRTQSLSEEATNSKQSCYCHSKNCWNKSNAIKSQSLPSSLIRVSFYTLLFGKHIWNNKKN